MPLIGTLGTASQKYIRSASKFEPGIVKSFFLNGNGANSQQNNTFLDASMYNATITKNGNVMQGSFNPFGISWSYYFNNSSANTISSPSHAAFALGAGDFTIELWINPSSKASAYPRLVNFNSTWNATNAICICCDSNDYPKKITFNAYNISTNFLVSTTSISYGTWYHVAITRQGSTFRLFINGNLEASATSSVNIDSNAASVMYLGNAPSQVSGEFYDGYISNMRLNKGSALYTLSFKPSAVPLVSVSGTSYLVGQSNNFIDNSGNKFALTISGTPKVDKFSPFQESYNAAAFGGSAFFDAYGDVLTLPASSAYSIQGDFTIEGWMYPFTAIKSYTALISVGGDYSAGTIIIYFNHAANQNKFSIYVNGGSALLSGTISPGYFGWTHFALTRSGNTWNLYVNGILDASMTYSGATASATPTLNIGSESATRGITDYIGYLSCVHVIKGTAIYTGSSFAVPTSAPSLHANTSFLSLFKNAGAVDLTSINTVDTVGTAQISTSQYKYGGSSIYFDGASSSYLRIPYSSLFNLAGVRFFTMEAWVYVSSARTNPIFSRWHNGGDWTFHLLSNNIVYFNYPVSGNSVSLATPNPISIMTWTHLAVVRNDTTITIYVNGTASVTGSVNSEMINVGSNDPHVGQGNIGSELFNGYIDDLCFIKGTAKYITNFTPTQIT